MGYARPTDMADALSLLAEGDWTVLAGGTDLYPATTAQQLSGKILDITALPGLGDVAQTNTGWRIGARTTWSQIARADLPPAFRALQQAAAEIGGVQIQNTGTIGGNLSNASPAADGVPALLILNASVELTSAGGIRMMPLANFVTGPRRTDLGPDELLSAVHIPASAAVGRSAFHKLGARRYLVISIAMTAARIETRDGRIIGAALSVGACSAAAQRLQDAEAALTGLPVDQAAGALGAEHVSTLTPIDDMRSTATYRKTAALELLRRAVRDALA